MSRILGVGWLVMSSACVPESEPGVPSLKRTGDY